ncbi:hypothetical protein GA0074692_1153 [Micromonospora pallida]|uniref:Uncharacterized protein n=1 Tax=Micromonospora pallida TaxID=145854 RepID=A0A1C6RWF7_9ACTN|nr:hypothetical protein GA0074692_1153 [Micromonospora pallida]
MYVRFRPCPGTAVAMCAAPVGMLLAVAGNQPFVSLVPEPRRYPTLPGILALAGFTAGAPR